MSSTMPLQPSSVIRSLVAIVTAWHWEQIRENSALPLPSGRSCESCDRALGAENASAAKIRAHFTRALWFVENMLATITQNFLGLRLRAYNRRAASVKHGQK